ncbi:hypothetical protein ABE41_011680 [Fictibacillus arsenicus]|uniref:Uncharacterized protein n=1 Tax=Fictibacillus arsenicus TaxID=255247 RepID=A0A1B1Z5G3_9BACL|nr:hypothetical protein ABE41_011680 [Fictibacillus arsenicus]
MSAFRLIEKVVMNYCLELKGFGVELPRGKRAAWSGNQLLSKATMYAKQPLEKSLNKRTRTVKCFINVE